MGVSVALFTKIIVEGDVTKIEFKKD
ncbi:uncharacterized protein G2W53_024888 [Senna tora]|uniref:Uncharacterized protein n=1 Tax=Senna tora TaxID=362788 RepID=A0A834TC20_9FABA|nr:uncharacterized protein G2W53_024888 [Senna tora]